MKSSKVTTTTEMEMAIHPAMEMVMETDIAALMAMAMDIASTMVITDMKNILILSIWIPNMLIILSNLEVSTINNLKKATSHIRSLNSK